MAERAKIYKALHEGPPREPDPLGDAWITHMTYHHNAGGVGSGGNTVAGPVRKKKKKGKG